MTTHSLQQFFDFGDLTDAPEQAGMPTETIDDGKAAPLVPQQTPTRRQPKPKSADTGATPWWKEFVAQ
jgi:hypothetical protein